MNVEILLEELIANKVKLSVKDNQLLCKLPESGINDRLYNQLKEYKEEVKEIIQKTTAIKVSKSSTIKAINDGSSKPLSFTQQRLWTLDQIEGSIHYNILNALLLKGDLKFDVFQKTFDTIVQRHEVLRTSYILDENDEMYQSVQAHQPFNILQYDLRKLSKEDQDKAIESIQLEDSTLAFDLKKDVLLRVKLLQIKDDEFVALVTMHHIATDGWSIGILIKEFSALYSAFCKGEKNPLADLEIQYADYAQWQQHELRDEKLEKLQNYWVTQLSNLPMVHSLPLDFARPTIQNFEGNTIRSYIDVETLNILKQICNKQGATLFTGLYSVFNILLARYSNEEEIVMGTPVANREQLEVENLIGFFANMLVLRSQVTENISFTDLINQNKQMLFDAYSNQQMPFDLLVSALQPERNPAYNALFQIMFVFQNNEKTEIKLPNLSLTQVEHKKPFALYDLSLTVDENENGLILSWEYSTSIFSHATIKRMTVHFEQLLNSVIKSPHNNISDANIICDKEKEKILTQFNQTSQSYPKDITVMDLFREQVKITPGQIAIKYDNYEYTYQELDELSNQLAAYLQDVYGVESNDLIGIHLERSEKLPLSIISILKAGAAYVPIGIDYPEDRVSYITKDAKLKVLINEEVLSNFFSEREKYSKGTLLIKIKPTDLAYCIYTSGSTGQPKGVLNQHDGLFNRLLWMKEYLKVTDRAVFLQKTPYTFDVSVWEFILPIIVGGTLIIPQPGGHKDPTYLKEIINRERVSIIHFVPSMLGIFLQFTKENAVPSLKHIICSGEALPAQMVIDSRQICPRTQIHNLYGPTEAAIDVTAIDLTNLDVSKGVSIGKPVANTRIYIVDKALNLVPIGIPGELLISGIQVAKGYLNLEKLNEERFIADPFIVGERVYRTGDFALWELDGTIKYLGRKDNQVKIRGNRIELESITSNLLQKPNIKDAIAVINQKGEEPAIVAYVVSDETQNSSELRGFLANKIPEYEIPNLYVQLEELPLNSNGKINYKLLPDPDFNTLKSGTEYIAPENEVEESLVEIFAKELSKDQNEIGTHDNFFDLGANSIKLIKILSKINRQFETAIKPVMLFQYATIHDFSNYVLNNGLEEDEIDDDIFIAEEMDNMIDLMEG